MLLPGSWWGGSALGRDGGDGSESLRCACRTGFSGSLCNRKSSDEDLLHKMPRDGIGRRHEIGWGRTEELSHRKWPWRLPGFPAAASLRGPDPLARQPVSRADLVIGLHIVDKRIHDVIDLPISLAVQPMGFQYMMISESR